MTRRARPLSDGDLRRLFPGGSLTDRRLDRLRTWLRVVITHQDRLVGVATCREVDGELRVPDLALDREARHVGVHQILHALLDAIELAATAGNRRSIVMSTPPVSPPGCSGGATAPCASRAREAGSRRRSRRVRIPNRRI